MPKSCASNRRTPPPIWSPLPSPSSRIDLAWQDNASNEIGFRIERCSGTNCASFVEIATVGANVTSYQNTGLLASTSYSYRVRALKQSGTSAYSNTASATTQAARGASGAQQPRDGCGFQQPDQPDLDRHRHKRERVPHRALQRHRLHVICRDRDGRRQCDQLSEHRSARLDELFVPRARLQSGWNLGVFEHGECDHPGVSAAPTAPTNLATGCGLQQPDQPDLDGHRHKRERVPHRALQRDRLHVICRDRDGRRQCRRVIRTLVCSPRRATRTACAPSIRRELRRIRTRRVRPPRVGRHRRPATSATVVASSSQINLTWTDTSTNESGFRIERCNGTGCTSFVEIATVGAKHNGISEHWADCRRELLVPCTCLQ